VVTKRLIVAVGVTLVLSIAATLITAQQPVPLPQPGIGSRVALELLTNSSFEDDTNGDKIPDGWTGKNTTAESADKQKCNKPDKLVAETGNCAFQFKGNADGSSSAIQQSVETGALTDGVALTFGAYIDPRSSVADTVFGKAQIKFSDGTKLKLMLAIPGDDTRAPEDYTPVEDVATLVIPSGVSVSSAKVKFGYNRTTGKFLIDDASLVVTIAHDSPTPTVTETATISFTPTTSVTPTPNATVTSDLTPTATLTLTPTPTPTPTALPLIAKLVADDGASDDSFGNSVALSADGNTVLVGSIYVNASQGVAYIFVRSGDVWVQQAKLIASDGAAGDYFGYSVALSADGNTALVGANYDNVGANQYQGSAYVFTRSGTTWVQQAALTANDGEAGDNFGWSVALSSDGNTALVGAPTDKVGMNLEQGSAYVFTRSDTIWTQQAALTANDGEAFDFSGWSVALSADGNTALVGAPTDKVDTNLEQGAAYIFVRSGTTWTEQAKLIASDGAADDYFGDSVALSADGNTTLVGASGNDVGTNQNQGSVYIFMRTSTVWTEQAALLASDGAALDNFGYSVALSGDGLVALIGAVYDDVGANINQGSAYLFSLP
jgi:hypothetical protein